MPPSSSRTTRPPTPPGSAPPTSCRWGDGSVPPTCRSFPRGPPVVTASLHVVADVDPPTWAADHALGRRPDASPYGLHRLADHGIELVAAAPAEPTGARAARVDRTLRHRGGGWEWSAEARTRLPPGVELRVCWDERTGVPAASRPGGAPVATGIIWLTDPPALPVSLAALTRRALRRSAAVWVVSEQQLPLVREIWAVPGSRLHHVPFGVDTDFWSPPAGAGRDDAPPVVLAVGNDRHRDHDGLVAAMAGLPAALELVSVLPVKVPRAVGRRTDFLDHAALRDRYAQASVVCVLLRPNRHVSGVTAVLEAQAMGRPLVLTDTPGMRAYVEPGVTAMLVPPGDVEAARTAIAGLLADPARAAAMGAAGRQFVQQHATSARMVATLAEILRAI